LLRELRRDRYRIGTFVLEDFMPQRVVTCYAQQLPDGIWEATCVDFDIAVTGRSFAEARRTMEHAVRTYLEDVARLAPEQRQRLLNRRTPWTVRAKLALKHMVYSVLERRRGEARHTQFALPCPA
jgi:hypothetical protein